MATPVFCCGAECGRTFVSDHLTSQATAPTFDTTTKRNGDRSIRFNITAGQSIVRFTLTASTRWVGRLFIRFTTLPSADTSIVVVGGFPALGPNVRFKQSDSSIYAAVGIITLGASGVAVTTGQWYMIDFDFNIDTAGNDFCDVQVNGTAAGQATATGLVTAPTVMDVGIIDTATADMYVDDVVCSNTAADYPIGDGYVNHFVPTSDGTHNVDGAADFRRGDTTTDITNATTTAFQLVDEVPLDDATPDTNDHIRIVAPPNATDYVELVFGPAPGISTPTVGPRAVEAICEVFAAGTGLSDEIIKLNDNGTVNNIYDGTQIAGVTTGTYKRKHYATAPTGGAWTVVAGAGNFNNIRLQYGFATDANPDKSLMCAMIEAEFAPIADEKTQRYSINNQQAALSRARRARW